MKAGEAWMRFARFWLSSHRLKACATWGLARFKPGIIIAILAVTVVWADVDLPQGPGREILENNCEECHGPDRIVNKAWSKVKWRATVKDMVARGAELKPDEIDTLVDYLSTYFGPDNKAG
jgi:mono/diheme cytochrome c family protein